jgi:Tol biopolymer transport system component
MPKSLILHLTQFKHPIIVVRIFSFLVIVLLCSCKKTEETPKKTISSFAINSKSDSGHNNLWFVYEDGSSFTEVIGEDLGGNYDLNPAWSSDGRTIYYTINSTQNGVNGVYSTKPNGKDKKAIYIDNATQNRRFLQLASSKDDEHLVFSLQIPRSGRTVIEIYRMCPCGQRVERLTSFETEKENIPVSTEAYAGTFSTNSQFLYFSQSYDTLAGLKKVGIYKMNVKTLEKSLLKEVRANNVAATTPAISPNGEKILFSIDDAIHIMNSDGTNMTTLANIKGHNPRWDPDNQTLYFTSSEIPDLLPGLYKTDITASRPVKICGNNSVRKFGGFSIN